MAIRFNVIGGMFNGAPIDNEPKRLNVRIDAGSNIKSFSIGQGHLILPFVPGWTIVFGPLIGLLPLILLQAGFVIGGDLCIRAWVRKQPLWAVAGLPLAVFFGWQLGAFFYQGLFQ